MEAIIIGSRSINQDRFLEKDYQEKYKKHLQALGSITKEKQHFTKEWEKEIQELQSTLRKSKSAAKIFKEKEQKNHLKEENMHLLKKIWNIEPSVSTYNSDRFQYISGSNWNSQKKKFQQINEENRMINKKLLMKQFESLNFKKKLKQQIKGYIQLRDSIRKFKVNGNKEKRSNSQIKLSSKAKEEKAEKQKPQNLPLIGKQHKVINPQLKG